MGNSLSGVLVFNAPSNTIGGIVTGARNIISGNTQRGVYLSGAGATGNLVQGNRIGTNAAGTADLGNSLSGVEIGSGASSNTIGGTTVAARNIISGNNQHGVYLLGSGTTGNMVRGNYVGTTVNGTTALGNMLAGVRLVGVSSNSIGGTASGAGNRIGFNGQNGVRVTGLGTANLILRNSIFTNTGLGIDLNGDGVTANDTNDSDTGPNKLQNFPVMTSVVLSGANLNITYSIPSITPNSTYPIRVEFFIADADNQEGKTFLSSHSYTSPGVKVATIPAGSAVLGTKIVATATDTNGAGSTSEFSANRTVASSLLAAGGAAPAGTGAASLTSAQQRPVVDSAISRLIAQGLTATQVNQLSSVTVDIADLPGAGGTEIHVGLNGNDPLSGGPGNEFLVVGRGQGVLNGKGNQNRLPPGVTHFAAVDDNTAFLQSISATQSGAGPFAARRAVLTPDLVPRSTVLNAGNAAPLTSHADLILDRLFAALADGVIKDAGDLLTLF